MPDPTHHVRDLHAHVVDDDGEVVRHAPVGTADDEIVYVTGGSGDMTEYLILNINVANAFRDGETDDVGLPPPDPLGPLGRRQGPALPRVPQRGPSLPELLGVLREILLGAEAGVRLVVAEQRVECGRV